MVEYAVAAHDVVTLDGDSTMWVARYKQALISVKERIPSKVEIILSSHCKALGRRLSVWQMGQAAGYKGTRAGSLQYGLFAKALAQAMEVDPPGPNNLSVIGEWDSTPDENGHGGWVMYDELAVALTELGWISAEQVGVFAPNRRELVTSRMIETEQRVGQDIFRDELLRYWKNCSVTGCTLRQILVASHIVPWVDASDFERLDVYNGLLLTPNLDQLFDQHLISFDEMGKIQIAPVLDNENLKLLGVNSRMKLRQIAPNHVAYLKRHLDYFKKLHSC